MGKGVMFTIISFLLSIIFLGLVFLIFNLNQYTSESAIHVSLFNQANSLFDSLSGALVNLFLGNSGVSVGLADGQLSISQLVDSEKLNKYILLYDGFKSFVESRETHVFIDNSSTANTRIYLTPVNIDYYFSNDSIYMTNFKDIDSVVFTVYKSDIMIENIDWKEFSSGNTSFTVVFKNQTSTLQMEKDVDLSSDVDVEFNRLVSGGPSELKLNKNGAGLFEVKTFQNASVFYNITITFNNATNLKVHMNNIVNISFPEFGLIKAAKPRIV